MLSIQRFVSLSAMTIAAVACLWEGLAIAQFTPDSLEKSKFLARVLVVELHITWCAEQGFDRTRYAAADDYVQKQALLLREGVDDVNWKVIVSSASLGAQEEFLQQNKVAIKNGRINELCAPERLTEAIRIANAYVESSDTLAKTPEMLQGGLGGGAAPVLPIVVNIAKGIIYEGRCIGDLKTGRGRNGPFLVCKIAEGFVYSPPPSSDGSEVSSVSCEPGNTYVRLDGTLIQCTASNTCGTIRFDEAGQTRDCLK